MSGEFGGNQAQPGVIESQFGLLNAVQRPQITTLGREAYATFPEKVAAVVFALLSYRPFRGGNRRLAFASMLAFIAVNGRTGETMGSVPVQQWKLLATAITVGTFLEGIALWIIGATS